MVPGRRCPCSGAGAGINVVINAAASAAAHPGRCQEVVQQLPGQGPVGRRGSGEFADPLSLGPGTTTPGSHDGAIDFRVELYPPGIAEAERLPRAGGRGGQVHRRRGDREAVVVPLEGREPPIDAGKQGIGDAGRGQADVNQAAFAAAIAPDRPPGHVGQ